MVQAKTIKQLAAEYGVNRKTFVEWLKAYGLYNLKRGYLFMPSGVLEIYAVLGKPLEYEQK